MQSGKNCIRVSSGSSKSSRFFRDTGRVCPVWIDKALSWNPEQARQIVETAREMKIPLMAGSSLPHAGFSPPFNWQNEKLEEVVSLFYGGP
jgi:hypothetical protein